MKKIRKIATSIGALGKVLNSKSTSQENTYSCDYINKLHAYSTEEQVIGTWIDGKTLYRKVIDFGSLPNNTYKQITHNIQNLDKIIKVHAIGLRADKTSISIPSLNTDLYVNDSIISITTTTDRNAFNGYVFLEYTKTTD